jgi:streptomycin 6-kinase
LTSSNASDRIQKHAREWGVVVEDALETETSVISFGTRNSRSVVLKVIKQPCDEWRSGEILEAFDGNGFVRVYEHAPGAVLVERLRPGNSLVEMALNRRDDEATDVLVDVIHQTTSVEPNLGATLQHCPTVHDWARGFELYLETTDEQIPRGLVAAGQRVFLDLCASQQRPRLLHGDLHHYNVLFDSDRGWIAIDPKGVIGEVEYEIGAVLRNPNERPDLFLSCATIERRLKQFTNKLHLDFERALAWGFAQAVLSAIWAIEDGFAVNKMNPGLRLAEVIRPMLRD